jgi:winged helix DNA-binding protein
MPSRRPTEVRTLSQRELNRTLLARQLLLERSKGSIQEAVEQVGGLQTQYAPSGYVGLWTRVAGFQRDDLTRALEDRSLIQATLMRTTIHIVSRREYWRFAIGMRRAQREWATRLGGLPAEHEFRTMQSRLRRALEDGPRTVRELDDLAKGFIGRLGLWVDLVRVPPSGTWERRRADRLALAEDWVGPIDATENEGLRHIVRAYLRAFGPAAWKDLALWGGVNVADARRAGQDLDLVTYRDEAGKQLVDLSGAEITPGGMNAPVRFLPHWDSNLLVHARRAGILPEEHRPKVFSTKNPFSVGVVLVDGRGVAAWSFTKGRIVVDEYQPLNQAARRAVERERRELEAFHA